jgi:hypothetical protein
MGGVGVGGARKRAFAGRRNGCASDRWRDRTHPLIPSLEREGRVYARHQK